MSGKAKKSSKASAPKLAKTTAAAKKGGGNKVAKPKLAKNTKTAKKSGGNKVSKPKQAKKTKTAKSSGGNKVAKPNLAKNTKTAKKSGGNKVAKPKQAKKTKTAKKSGANQVTQAETGFNDNGHTPLMAAVAESDLKAVIKLLQNDSIDVLEESTGDAPDVDENPMFNAPYTALEHAIDIYKQDWSYGNDIMPDDDRFKIVQAIAKAIKKSSKGKNKSAGMVIVDELKSAKAEVKELNDECGLDECYDDEGDYCADGDDPREEYRLWDQLIELTKWAFA